MTNGAYLRYPHLHGDLVTFVADDDVWLAPLTGGRAWRFTADRVSVSYPRFSPDGARIAWTGSREGAAEVFAAEIDGGESERLTHWGGGSTSVRGWTADGRVLAVSATGQSSDTRRWAYAVPLDGGPATRLPYGWVSDVSIDGPIDGPIDGAGAGAGTGSGTVSEAGGGARVVTVSSIWREPSQWKRYRGGTAAKIWVDAEGDGEFTRLFADSAAQYWSVSWSGDRIVYLSDVDGVGNVYSCLPDGSDVRRHSSHEEFYARHATSDGERVVYSHAGDLWLMESLDAEPYRLDVMLGGPRPGRARQIGRAHV